MTNIALDKSKPYQVVKDFITQRSTFVQGGRKFSEQGFPILGVSDSAVKYLCPQCDFKSSAKSRLIEHAEAVHHASDVQLAVLKVYIQNIDRNLPADEGIDWAKMKLTRTSAQKVYDEKEAQAGTHANGHQVNPEGYSCELCPDLKPFSKKSLLGSHRWHKHKIKANKGT